MSKEHPILFSTPMVQAVLEGRKTKTRRIIKPQPDDNGLWNHTTRKMSLDSDLEGWWGTVYETGEDREFKCPYGEPGHTLWVREPWQNSLAEITGNKTYSNKYYYKADDSTIIKKWKPSIFMPRAACRIFLEVKNIRVERLQDISEVDAIAEGILKDELGYKDYDKGLAKEYGHPDYDWPHLISPVDSYKSLWQSINGKESWNENPFVWVIEFKKI